MKINFLGAVISTIATICLMLGLTWGSSQMYAWNSPRVIGLLQGTPFSDFSIPMLLLAIVVGGSALLAAATVFIRREWAVLVSAVAGLIMIAREVTEVTMVQQFSWFEVLFTAIGMVVIGLASYLWITEYRSHHFHGGHVSHA